MKVADSCRLAVAGTAVLAVLAAAACASPERPLLEQFFGASRLRDITALQGVATVVFEPREQGIVRSFDITAVTAERVEGMTVLKDVTVEAPVFMSTGETVQKTLVITMRREAGRSGPWQVVAFRDAAASPPSRRP